MNELELRNKGFVQQTDGSWAKRPRAVGAMEANRPKCSALSALDCGLQEPTGRKTSMAVFITLLAFRHRLLDQHDAVAYAFKPLTDAIAESLSVDDADKRLHWQYEQVRTSGPEGTVVLISV